MDPGEIPDYVSFDSLCLRFLCVAVVVDKLTSLTSAHAARGNPIDVVEWTFINDATKGATAVIIQYCRNTSHWEMAYWKVQYLRNLSHFLP